MRIYISLPISGCDLSKCQARAERVKAQLKALGHLPISPFDICKNQKKPYAYFMGKDIQALLGCDAIFLLSGWSDSSGCQLEWRCAQIYNKKIYQHLKEIPNNNEEIDK